METENQKAGEQGGHEPGLFAFPLNPQQLRIWHADRAKPGDRVNNLSFRLELRGALDVRVMEQVCAELVARHEVLRATCSEIDGAPSLLIAERCEIRVSSSDLRLLPPAERPAALERVCTQEAQASFDIVRGPVLRVGLIRADDQHHVLTLTLHAIVCDGWSIGILTEEIARLYAAFAKDLASPLAPLPIQYGDYTVWHQERLASPDVCDQAAKLAARLSGARLTTLTPDAPRHTPQARDSEIVSTLLDRPLTTALKRWSDSRGGTLYTTALAAVLSVVHRYSGADDLVISSPVANRGAAEIEPLVGPIATHILLRVPCSGSATLSEFATTARDAAFEAFAHQIVPAELVMAAQGQALPAPINFVCQTEYGRAGTSSLDFDGVSMRSMPSRSPGALHDVNVFMVERDAQWRLSIEYRTSVVSNARALGLLKDIETTLQRIVAADDTRLCDLPLAGLAAHQTAPAAAPVAAPPASTGAETAALAPAAPAVPDAAYMLPASFSQEGFWLLQRWSGEAATQHIPVRVRIKGPLDIARLEAAFQALLQRHESLRTGFRESEGELWQLVQPIGALPLETMDLSRMPPALRHSQLEAMLQAEAERPFDLAQPPLLRARLWRLEPDHCVLAITLHHIVSDGQSIAVMQEDLWTIYEALARGTSADLPKLELQFGDYAVAQRDWIGSPTAKPKIDYWMRKLAPPLPILDFPLDRPVTGKAVSRAAVGTHHLPPDLIAGLKQLARDQQTTTFVIAAAAFTALLGRLAHAPNVIVGTPSANRRDETNGIIGPFAGALALRLDISDNPSLSDLIARVRGEVSEALDAADVPLEYLVERIDVRGRGGHNPLFQFYFQYHAAFLQSRRVGGIEIEPLPPPRIATAHELQLDVIETDGQATAIGRYNPDLLDDGTMSKILAGYERVLRAFVADPSQSLATLEFSGFPGPTRALASRRLPVAADDRQPRSSTEAEVLRIWETVLGQSGIGIHDDFFDLGGHSLHVANCVQKIERAFGVHLDISTLAVSRTVADLSRKIEQSAAHTGPQAGADRDIVVPLQPHGHKPPMFCVHGGGGHILHFKHLAARLPHDRPMYGLSAPDIDGAKYSLDMEELAKLYIDAIRKVYPSGPFHICGYSAGATVAYAMATRLAEAGETTGKLIMLDGLNWHYYRNMPLSEQARFWWTVIVNRTGRYWRNLANGHFDVIAYSLAYLVHRKIQRWTWQIARKLFSYTDRPLPKAVKSNMELFTSMAEKYAPRPYPGDILLIRTMPRDLEYNLNPTLGWEKVAAGGVRVKYIGGDHLTFMQEPNVGPMVDVLVSHLQDKT